MTFTYSRRPHFYETDAMGIIHHASYFYYLEESRVAFLREHGLLQRQPLQSINYPVLKADIEYKNPIYYEDELTVEVSFRVDKVRLHFDYTLQTKRFSQPVAFGKTMHVAMNMETKRPIRVPQEIRELLK